MVAVPHWYHFYHDALRQVLRKKPEVRVLISACADYGMLQLLHEVIVQANVYQEIIIYDICSSPLKSCEFYAKRHGLKIECYQGNILIVNIEEAFFDLIVTDEFLTVLILIGRRK